MKFLPPRATSFVSRVIDYRLLDPSKAAFALNSFIASMMAIYIAFRLDLQRPYWAMLTVYLTSQPLVGALRSKALFRIVGTILGASAAVILVPALVNEPLLLSLAITAWAGFCLYVSLLDRTPRSYAFMLAGYTATTVAFSSVTAPDAIFATALARVEEIALGITCATIVHGVLFPRDVSGVLRERTAKSVRDAGMWVAEALLGTAEDNPDRMRLARDVTELEMLSTHLPFDSAATAPPLWAVRALQNRLATVLPLLSAVEDRLATLRAVHATVPELDGLTRAIAAWARNPDAPQESVDHLRRRCEQTAPGSVIDWPTLLTASARTSLCRLIDALSDGRKLESRVADPFARNLGSIQPGRCPPRRCLDRDHGMALLSVFALAVAVLGCCTMWIATSWPEGGTAAQMAAIYSALYGAQDDPAPELLSFVLWTLASLPVAAIYLFAIFPAIDGFPLLFGTLAPSFLAMGYLQANPRHTLKALALLIGIIGALDLQPRFFADFASFANVNSAELVGIIMSFLAMRIFRSIHADRIARRRARRSWRDVTNLASARAPVDRDKWLSPMLDRLGLLISRPLPVGPNPEAREAFVALQVGLDLIDLMIAQDTVGVARGAASEIALQRIFQLCRAFAKGRSLDQRANSDVLGAVDSALREICDAAPQPTHTQGLVALTGLRRCIFPKAPPFIPEKSS